MTTLNISGSIDALANRIQNIAGIGRCYTVTGTDQDAGQLFPIPPSFDIGSGVVANVWYRGTSQMLPGNIETIVWQVDANVWARGTEGGFGYRVLMPFTDLFVTAFRNYDALTLGGAVTKCVIDNIGEIVPQPINNGQLYLVLPITFALLNEYESSDYAA